MSHEGKLKRGAKWWSQRDRDDKLPEGVESDPNKMADVNYFLESSKKEEKKKGGK